MELKLLKTQCHNKNQLFPVIILAGGLATRLWPVTEKIPKSLIEIDSKPFIHYQLTYFKKMGVEEIVLCVGYLAEQIAAYVGDGSKFGLQVSYSSDWPKLLGTAGAIKKALPLIQHDNFFVIYGDSFLTCNYFNVQQKFIESDSQGLMTVYRNDDQFDRSNVEYANGKIITYDKVNRTDKMLFIDYGLGLFKKSAFLQVPDEIPYDLSLLYQNLLQQEALASYEVKERFYEIGSLEGQQDLSVFLRANNFFNQRGEG